MNNRIKFVSELFEPGPFPWGLRGDPPLWEDMRKHTITTPIPDSKEKFLELIHQLFNDLVGEPLQRGKNIYVQKYNTGGMSQGMIGCDFWLDKAIPVLLQNFENRLT